MLKMNGPMKSQQEQLDEIKESLAKRNIELVIRFDPYLHDREIRLSNGWIIKIGRGLDYFKPPGFN
jgi:ATP-dependent Lon protease